MKKLLISFVIPSKARNLAFIIPSILILTLTSVVLAQETVPYPSKTGQTLCYRGYSPFDVIACPGQGQDGTYLRGVAWPVGAARWEGIDSTGTGTVASKSCVRDKLTGLIWQRVVNIPSSNWATALTTAENLNLCGWSDWRLPNVNELYSLLDFSQAVQSTYFNSNIGFSNVQAYYYWTSTTDASNPTSMAWFVNIDASNIGTYSKSNSDPYVWPVRSGL